MYMINRPCLLPSVLHHSRPYSFVFKSSVDSRGSKFWDPDNLVMSSCKTDWVFVTPRQVDYQRGKHWSLSWCEWKNLLNLGIMSIRFVLGCVLEISELCRSLPLVLQMFPESESRWVNGREGWSAGKIIRKQFLLLSDCEGVIMANFNFQIKCKPHAAF